MTPSPAKSGHNLWMVPKVANVLGIFASSPWNRWGKRTVVGNRPTDTIYAISSKEGTFIQNRTRTDVIKEKMEEEENSRESAQIKVPRSTAEWGGKEVIAREGEPAIIPEFGISLGNFTQRDLCPGWEWEDREMKLWSWPESFPIFLITYKWHGSALQFRVPMLPHSAQI